MIMGDYIPPTTELLHKAITLLQIGAHLRVSSFCCSRILCWVSQVAISSSSWRRFSSRSLCWANMLLFIWSCRFWSWNPTNTQKRGELRVFRTTQRASRSVVQSPQPQSLWVSAAFLWLSSQTHFPFPAPSFLFCPCFPAAPPPSAPEDSCRHKAGDAWTSTVTEGRTKERGEEKGRDQL